MLITGQVPLVQRSYQSLAQLSIILSQSKRNYSNISTDVPSPGLKYRHYAPKATVQWLSDVEQLVTHRKPSIIFIFDKTPPYTPSFVDKAVKDGHTLLCCEFSWERFGQLLYDTFRMADAENYPHIFIQDIRSIFRI